MPKFIVTYASGVIEEEIVQDCTTLEEYINRKFGSSNIEEFGTKVALDTPKPAVSNQEAYGNFNVEVKMPTAPEPVKLKDYLMNADTGFVGSKLNDIK